MCRILKKHGWLPVRTKGSHDAFQKPDNPVTVIVPVHRNKNLKAGTQHAIMNDAGLSHDDIGWINVQFFVGGWRSTVPRQFKLGPVGPADTTNLPGKQGVGSKSVADSVALDPNLAKIVAAWKKLPEPIRRAILALIG